MDANTILRIKPQLTRFLHQFDDCFGRVTTRRYLDLYVEWQLSNLQRKSIEPMADAVGEPPRNLQQSSVCSAGTSSLSGTGCSSTSPAATGINTVSESLTKPALSRKATKPPVCSVNTAVP